TLAGIQGVYRFRVLASGVTLRGIPFTREQLLSGAVVPGGDNPFPTSGPSTHDRDKAICDLLQCLLRPEALGRFLNEHKVDSNVVRGCIEQWCKARLAGPSEAELQAREGTSTASTIVPPSPGSLSKEVIAALGNIMTSAGVSVSDPASLLQAIRSAA